MKSSCEYLNFDVLLFVKSLGKMVGEKWCGMPGC